jgi:hypothetical protein
MMIGEDANHTAKRLPCIEYQLRRSGIFIENAINMANERRRCDITLSSTACRTDPE